VYGVDAGRDEDSYLGTFPAVAESEVKRLKAREMKGCNWAEQHHNKGFVTRMVVVETDFGVPSGASGQLLCRDLGEAQRTGNSDLTRWLWTS
jgi:hypothetical protein